MIRASRWLGVKKDNEELKFVIPESIVTNLLRIHHEMAHRAVEKTLNGMKETIWNDIMLLD